MRGTNCASGMPFLVFCLCFFYHLAYAIPQRANVSMSNSYEADVKLDQQEKPSLRIVGGQNAAEGQFPFQVSLEDNESGLHVCGGSIISANYVVTAAHCVTNEQGVVYPVTKIIVRAGTTQIRKDSVVVGIAQITPHPQYLNPQNNDIALLRLTCPLTFSDRIKAIPLASADPPTSATVIISGWGRTSTDGPPATQLQYNTLRPITNAECRKYFSDVPQTVLCLAHTAGNGACYGDGGGPAIYNGNLVGVANFIFYQCGSNKPDGYASISSFRNWLRQNSDVK
ncbi:serine protease SP24D-like [Anastrepha ludens]|uniref:serine protease SP24D-like n=1 Tax=Anastrepha ludens TaxID=28586 RepID=UPI0023B0D262|nr:serine protease SP24D-like [Anastrepha ludens]